MKVNLKPDEKKQLDDALQSNSVRRWFRHRDNIRFEVGDVLVKYYKRTDTTTSKITWKVENINSDNKMAQRYVYVYEDENGIGFIKPLRLSDGALGKELSCMTDFDLDSCKFEVDPEYAEHVLLDADFDIKKIHKASLVQRKIVTKMNRKIGFKPKSLQEFNEFFEKLKIGDTFWTSADFTGRYVSEYTLSKITKVSLTDLDRQSSWDWNRYKERVKHKGLAPINSTYAYRITTTGGRTYSDLLVMDLHSYIFYTSKPAQEEKK